MRLVKLLKYKTGIIKILHEPKWDSHPYEYKIFVNGKWINDRTSHSSMVSVLRYAKLDFDAEENS